MKAEKQKMLAGEFYDSADAELVEDRLHARKICHALATLDPVAVEQQRAVLSEQLFRAKTDVYVTPPFFCDYGYNIKLGRKVYFNFNCIVLDVAEVRIGNNVLFGPAVQVYTATHPMEATERSSGLEFGKPVEIGDDVWIGGGAIICPGVKIGSGAVIGAGSVVTRDIPVAVFAAGNPCRVIRQLQ